MLNVKMCSCFLILGAIFVCPPTRATEFDPQQHMDIDEIEVGMRGYGLTVFHGTKIEKFEVEVVSVVRNMGIKRDAFLIRCLDERFDVAKVVQGVSGSPVFLNDRLAGAMAFGYKFSVEPLYGVTPIRDMFETRDSVQPREKNRHASRSQGSRIDQDRYSNLMADTLLSHGELQQMAVAAGLAASTETSDDTGGLIALPVPIASSGFSAQATDQIRQIIPGWNVAQSVASSDTPSGNSSASVQLERGSVLTIPLVMGDISLAVTGTTTEVIGDRVYGFGHPWNGIGDSFWPMGTGMIHTFVNTITISHKMGSPLDIVGVIRGDEAPSVYGKVGEPIELAKVQVEVEWPYINQQEQFEFDLVKDDLFSGFLGPAIMVNCMTYRGELPLQHCISYEGTMEYEGLEPLTYKNVSSRMMLFDIGMDVQLTMLMLLNNPWQAVPLERLTFKAVIEDVDRVQILKSAQMPVRHYQPGETVTSQVRLEPRRGEVEEKTISLKLPEETPGGKYKVSVGSFLNFRRNLQQAQPHRAAAFDAADVRRILQERLSLPRNALYISMPINPVGVAVEGQPLMDLPASRAALLIDKSRAQANSPIRNFIHSSIETEHVVDGNHTFEIEVKRE
jgi:hypothetical protein